MCNTDEHVVIKLGTKVGEGNIKHWIITRTCVRSREEYQDINWTSKRNNQHITILLPTIPYHHSHSLICVDMF